MCKREAGTSRHERSQSIHLSTEQNETYKAVIHVAEGMESANIRRFLSFSFGVAIWFIVWRAFVYFRHFIDFGFCQKKFVFSLLIFGIIIIFFGRL